MLGGNPPPTALSGSFLPDYFLLSLLKSHFTGKKYHVEEVAKLLYPTISTQRLPSSTVLEYRSCGNNAERSQY